MTKQHSINSMKDGYTPIVHPANSDLAILTMGRLSLAEPGMEYSGQTGDREMGINILSGAMDVSVQAADGKSYDFNGIGKRKNVFDGQAEMVYLPAGCRYAIRSACPNLDAAVYEAPAEPGLDPAVASQGNVIAARTGRACWTRFVSRGFGDTIRTGSLILGETANPSGNWSGYPPHKHDEPGEHECLMEEVYWFHFDNPRGFAFIRLYTDHDAGNPFDEAYAVKDGDVITISRGYHCIAVAPGYRCRYLFGLAGRPSRYGAWRDDPAHAWIRGCEAVLDSTRL